MISIWQTPFKTTRLFLPKKLWKPETGMKSFTGCSRSWSPGNSLSSGCVTVYPQENAIPWRKLAEN